MQIYFLTTLYKMTRISFHENKNVCTNKQGMTAQKHIKKQEKNELYIGKSYKSFSD